MSGELPAWTRGELRVEKSVFDAVEADALACYPSEACGFIAGPAEDATLLDETIVAINLADQIHARDPELHPRTSKEYFWIDPLQFERTFDRAQKSGRPIKVVYHSHCDAKSGASFSAEDTATFSWAGVLVWPCAFVVVSVVHGRVVDRKLWIHVPGEDRFAESRLEIR